MHIMTTIGLVLGAGIIVTDHHIVKIPSKLAVPLYLIAVVLMITGLVLSRQQT